MVVMNPNAARDYWRALLENATGSIRDAQALFDIASFGRARSLAVLAEEELGKATTVYDKFADAWTTGESTPRDLPTETARHHLAKYAAAYEFGRELEAFWGGGYETQLPDGDDWQSWGATEWKSWHEDQQAKSLAAARAANADKQSGFYVDLTDEGLSTPDRFEEGDVADQLVRAARVIEMMLIKDHTRMQHLDDSRYDGTHSMQWSLMRTSHEELWIGWVQRAARREENDLSDDGTDSRIGSEPT